jgi:hypothetical protein
MAGLVRRVSEAQVMRSALSGRPFSAYLGSLPEAVTPFFMKSFLKFLGSPAFAIIASVCSIAGLATGFYFYYASIQRPDLSFYINPIRTPIVRSSDAEGLSISIKGKEVSGNISAARITIWNAGKQPLRSTDVLTPIKIKVAGGSRVLEARIQNPGRPATRVKLVHDEMESGIVKIEWQILERDDGCVVQLIYEGGLNEEIVVTGDVVGQAAISKVQFKGSIQTPEEQYRPKKKGVFYSITDLLSRAGLMLYFTYYIRAHLAETTSRAGALTLNIFKWTFLALNLAIIISGLLIMILPESRITPFDP